MERFIPAHAGNTDGECECPPAEPVHPRTRGEHIVKAAVPTPGDGSSPHTRGTLQREPAAEPPARFIPAHAGNTNRGADEVERLLVHPRTRGEHLGTQMHDAVGSGSSPHTRGTRLDLKFHSIPGRFIPAHAGNTAPRRRQRQLQSVHPRTRGEHLFKIVAPGGIERFIPAHAGNTGLSHVCIITEPVHPRTRGEHTYRKPLIQKQKSVPKKSTDLPPDKSSRQRPTSRSRQSTQPAPQSPPPPARGYRSQSPGTAC